MALSPGELATLRALAHTFVPAADAARVAAIAADALVRAVDPSQLRQLRLVLRDSAGRSWPAGNVPWPSRWLVRLDTPPIDSATRRALARAFDESALYSEDARTVSLPRQRSRAPAHAARTARLVSSHAPRAARLRRTHSFPRT